jgi:hypothetical protein
MYPKNNIFNIKDPSQPPKKKRKKQRNISKILLK